jgi:hypothetical protein
VGNPVSEECLQIQRIFVFANAVLLPAHVDFKGEFSNFNEPFNVCRLLTAVCQVQSIGREVLSSLVD